MKKSLFLLLLPFVSLQAYSNPWQMFDRRLGMFIHWGVYTSLWPDLPTWAITQQLIKTAFSQRRKQLQTSLKVLNIPPEAFSQANISPASRPEQIDPHSFISLAKLSLK